MESLEDLMTVGAFVEAYPHLFETEEQLRWYLRRRKENGWQKAGAVVEIFSSPDASRPTLRINAPRLFKHLLDTSMAA